MTKFGIGSKIALVLAVAIVLIGALPTIIPSAPYPEFMRPVTLGLDLRGGVHLLLEVDEAGLNEAVSTRIQNEARAFLRDEGAVPRSVTEFEGGLRLRFGSDVDLERTAARLRPVLRDTAIATDGDGISVTFGDEALSRARSSAVDQSLEIIRRRIDETGAREPNIQASGLGRILVQMPGEQDPDRLKRILGKTARLTFHMVDEGAEFGAVRSLPAHLERTDSYEKDPNGDPVFSLIVGRRVLLGGEHLTDANPSVDEAGRPVVQFRFDTYGARTFGRITQDNIGKRLAILLDGEVISAPVIKSAILGGSGVIEGGNMSVVEARDLSVLMRAGALPVPLNIVEERTVGAGLGRDSIRLSIYAAILAVVLVAAYMTAVYRWFGIFSVAALLCNGLLLIALLSLIDATLTLPGLAGIVLTAGMAVDANVLIFERIREEWASGLKLARAVDNGFSRAFVTILDSNLTTLFAALILFVLGAGPVRGFGVTLSLGVLTSVFTAFMVTRALVSIWLRRRAHAALPY